MFKYRFLRIQTMSFIQIVHLSCKCDFSKTHLQYDARILFQPDPFRYTVESRIRKCSDFVIKSESHRQILVKNRIFHVICNSRAKRFRLRFFFALKISKVNLGGASCLKPSRKTWSKTVESGGMNGKYNIFKTDFLKSGS